MSAYSAAYIDKETEKLFNSFGIYKKRPHLTTCFDSSSKIMNVHSVGFSKSEAIIGDIVEWDVCGLKYLVAEIIDCEWAFVINKHFKEYGAIENLEFKPHITLIKNCEPGSFQDFKDLIGNKITFDLHSIKKF